MITQNLTFFSSSSGTSSTGGWEVKKYLITSEPDKTKHVQCCYERWNNQSIRSSSEGGIEC